MENEEHARQRQIRERTLEFTAGKMNLDVSALELSKSDGTTRTSRELMQVAQNKNEYAEASRTQGARLDAHNSPMDAQAAFFKAGQDDAHADMIRKAEAFLSAPNDEAAEQAFLEVKTAMETFKGTSSHAQNYAAELMDARREIYTAEIQAATSDVLLQRGLTPAEVAVFSQAAASFAVESEANLQTNAPMAKAFASQMRDGLLTNTQSYTDVKPDASRLHDAMAQAFNTQCVTYPDGDKALKRKGGGDFSISKSDAALREAAAANGVELKVGGEIRPSTSVAGAPIRFDENAGVSANETFRVTFTSPIGNSDTNQGIAKRDKPVGDSRMSNDQFRGLDDSMVTVGEMGDQTTRELNLITRSVASSQVGKALGVDVVVDEAYATAPDGGYINVSAMSTGSAVFESVKGEDGNTIQNQTKFKFDNANIQRGLYDLEAVDYLTGQIDRHGGNIFINPDNGQVQGIDNDLCFGTKPLSEALKDQAVGAKTVGHPPLFYHQETAKMIEELTPERLEATLRAASSPDGGHRLDNEEIKAALGRLEVMKGDVQIARHEGRVVAKFDDDTFKKSVEHNRSVAGEAGFDGKYGATGNYVGRCQMELDLAVQRVEQKVPGVGLKDPNPVVTDSFRQTTQEARKLVSDAKADALANPTPDIQAAQVKVTQCQAAMEQAGTQLQDKLKANDYVRDNKVAMNQKAAAAAQGRVDELKSIDKKAPLSPDQAKLISAVSGVEVKPGQVLSREDIASAYNPALRKLNAAVDRLKSPSSGNADLLSTVRPEKAELDKAAKNLENAKAELAALVNNDPRVTAARQACDQKIQAQRQALEPPAPANNIGQNAPQAEEQPRRIVIGERPPLQRPPEPPPPVPDGSVRAGFRTPPRPQLQRPDGPAPTPPELAAAKEAVAKVKEDLKAEQEPEKNTHERKNSVGAGFKRSTPDKTQGPRLAAGSRPSLGSGN